MEYLAFLKRAWRFLSDDYPRVQMALKALAVCAFIAVITLTYQVVDTRSQLTDEVAAHAATKTELTATQDYAAKLEAHQKLLLTEITRLRQAVESMEAETQHLKAELQSANQKITMLTEQEKRHAEQKRPSIFD